MYTWQVCGETVYPKTSPGGQSVPQNHGQMEIGRLGRGFPYPGRSFGFHVACSNLPHWSKLTLKSLAPLTLDTPAALVLPLRVLHLPLASRSEANSPP